MARIPVYQRQTSAAMGTQIDLPRVGADAFGAPFGESVAQLGGQMRQAELRRRREAEEAADNAAMTSGAKAFEEAQAEVLKARDVARTEAAGDGGGHVDRVLAVADEQQARLLEPMTNGRVRRWAEQRWAALRANLDVQESGWATGLRAGQVTQNYAEARDLRANHLFTSPDRAGLDQALADHDALVDGLAVPADVRAKLKTEHRHLFAEQYARGLAERDPWALRRQIDEGGLNSLLAPSAMATLRNRADAEIRSLEAAHRAEVRAQQAQAREALRERREAARDYVSGIQAALTAGVPVPIAEVRQAARISAGMGNPGQAMAIATLGTRAAINTNYGRLSPAELQQAEQDLSTAIARAGPNASPLDIAARDQLRDLRAAQRRETSDDLLGWEARYGQRIPPLDPEQPETFAARGRIARAAARRYGVPPQPLTSTEADAFALRLTEGTPQQKMVAATQLAQFGPTAPAAARQLALKDPLAGWAIGLAAQGRFAATQDLFHGADYLKANPKLAPAADVDRRFANLIGDAFRFMPAAEAPAKAAATQIYAARHGRTGGTSWRPQAFDAGVRMALGGVRGADGVDRGGLGRWRERPVVLPAGVSQQDLEAAMARLTDDRLKAAPNLRPVDDQGNDVSAMRIRGSDLYSAGDGHYYVVMPGASYPLRRPDGRLFTLRIGPQGAPR